MTILPTGLPKSSTSFQEFLILGRREDTSYSSLSLQISIPFLEKCDETSAVLLWRRWRKTSFIYDGLWITSTKLFDSHHCVLSIVSLSDEHSRTFGQPYLFGATGVHLDVIVHSFDRPLNDAGPSIIAVCRSQRENAGTNDAYLILYYVIHKELVTYDHPRLHVLLWFPAEPHNNTFCYLLVFWPDRTVFYICLFWHYLILAPSTYRLFSAKTGNSRHATCLVLKTKDGLNHD